MTEYFCNTILIGGAIFIVVVNVLVILCAIFAAPDRWEDKDDD